MPTEIGATAGLSGDMSLASGDGGPDVLHTDAVPEGHATESRSIVRRAGVAFERMRGYAMPRARSRDLILRLADEVDGLRWAVAEDIAAELADGKSQRQLAVEISKSQSHISKMLSAWKRYGSDSLENRLRCCDSWLSRPP
jgi:hypothetical protein